MAEASGPDGTTRPRRPRQAGVTATASGRAGQRMLIAVHRHLRGELTRIGEAVDEIAGQRLTPEQARDMINRTTMRQNYWTLGAFCAAYCRVVSMHHTIEDQTLFPTLRRADGGLGPVLDRLGEEHEVIAGLLDGVDRALVELISGRIGVDGVRAAVDELSAMLLSHLAYEEDELLEPIGEFSIVV